MTITAKVAVENAAFSFDKAFDYGIPPELRENVQPGCRVLVPFGAGNRKRQGLVFSVGPGEPGVSMKDVAAVLDKAPLLSREALRLAEFLKERTFCTLFEAARLLLPTGISLKIKSLYTLAKPLAELDLSPLDETKRQLLTLAAAAKEPTAGEKLLKKRGLNPQSPLLDELAAGGYLLKTSGAFRQVGDATKRMVRLTGKAPERPTPKQKAVLQVLDEVGEASLKEVCYYTGVTPAVVNTLEKNGTVQTYELEVYRNPYGQVTAPQAQEEILLSPDQQRAFDGLLEEYQSGKGGVSLLYGVTGSGKTSVFLKLIDQVAAQGRGVIVMVPEISLTPQTVSQFHARYGGNVAVFHSGLSLAERLDEWKRVHRGEARIAVGTRSAVFAPLDDVGLIVLDEEQEYTYKSESSPRYHARDVAKFRCAYHKALLVLSSATPSLESFYMAQTGRYRFHELPQRYGEAVLPRVTVTDMNRELEEGNATLFGRELLAAMRQNLENGRQSIVLLNRRGYNTFVSCKSCGHVVSCPNCSISLTYHSANNRLMCHYCGYSVPFSNECPQCHEEKVRYAGFGTQRAQEQLSALLPQARILRLDADTTMERFAYEKKLKQFAAGEYDVILGTQMVAKGLDFENVTLVGVLSADQALYSDDFRSYERAFDLLTQVVGRSGRGRMEGRAIVQTFTPENPVIQLAARQDYRRFYEGEIALRKAMLYPPFADICVVGFVGANEQKTALASREFLAALSQLAKSEYSGLPLRVLSPSPACIAKVSNKYRYKLIVKCRNCTRFREMMARLLAQFPAQKGISGVTVFADINPDLIL